MESTQEEQDFIDNLRRVLRKCPKSVWLFANPDGLGVMRYGVGNVRAIYRDGVDPKYMIENVSEGVEIDGGDW